MCGPPDLRNKRQAEGPNDHWHESLHCRLVRRARQEVRARAPARKQARLRAIVHHAAADISRNACAVLSGAPRFDGFSGDPTVSRYSEPKLRAPRSGEPQRGLAWTVAHYLQLYRVCRCQRSSHRHNLFHSIHLATQLGHRELRSHGAWTARHTIGGLARRRFRRRRLSPERLVCWVTGGAGPQ